MRSTYTTVAIQLIHFTLKCSIDWQIRSFGLENENENLILNKSKCWYTKPFTESKSMELSQRQVGGCLNNIVIAIG